MPTVNIITSAVAGKIFTANPPFSTHVTQAQIRSVMNPLIVQDELNQPEGTPLQLVLSNVSSAETIATHLNAQFQAGKLQDAGTGEQMVAWAGSQTIAEAKGSTLILRWRKAQPFVVVAIWGIVIIAAIIAVYLIIRQLRGSSWSLSKLTHASSTQAPATGPPLGVPWWEWIVGGAVVVVAGPYVIREIADYRRAEADLRQTRRL